MNVLVIKDCVCNSKKPKSIDYSNMPAKQKTNNNSIYRISSIFGRFLHHTKSSAKSQINSKSLFVIVFSFFFIAFNQHENVVVLAFISCTVVKFNILF